MYSVAQDSSHSSPSDDQASGSCDLAVVLSRLSVYRREAKSSYENVENWLTKNRKAQQELDHERAEINLLFEEFAGLQQEREQAIFEHHQEEVDLSALCSETESLRQQVMQLVQDVHSVSVQVGVISFQQLELTSRRQALERNVNQARYDLEHARINRDLTLEEMNSHHHNLNEKDATQRQSTRDELAGLAAIASDFASPLTAACGQSSLSSGFLAPVLEEEDEAGNMSSSQQDAFQIQIEGGNPLILSSSSGSHLVTQSPIANSLSDDQIAHNARSAAVTLKRQNSNSSIAPVMSNSPAPLSRTPSMRGLLTSTPPPTSASPINVSSASLSMPSQFISNLLSSIPAPSSSTFAAASVSSTSPFCSSLSPLPPTPKHLNRSPIQMDGPSHSVPMLLRVQSTPSPQRFGPPSPALLSNSPTPVDLQFSSAAGTTEVPFSEAQSPAASSSPVHRILTRVGSLNSVNLPMSPPAATTSVNPQIERAMTPIASRTPSSSKQFGNHHSCASPGSPALQRPLSASSRATGIKSFSSHVSDFKFSKSPSASIVGLSVSPSSVLPTTKPFTAAWFSPNTPSERHNRPAPQFIRPKSASPMLQHSRSLNRSKSFVSSPSAGTFSKGTHQNEFCLDPVPLFQMQDDSCPTEAQLVRPSTSPAGSLEFSSRSPIFLPHSASPASRGNPFSTHLLHADANLAEPMPVYSSVPLVSRTYNLPKLIAARANLHDPFAHTASRVYDFVGNKSPQTPDASSTSSSNHKSLQTPSVRPKSASKSAKSPSQLHSSPSSQSLASPSSEKSPSCRVPPRSNTEKLAAVAARRQQLAAEKQAEIEERIERMRLIDAEIRAKKHQQEERRLLLQQRTVRSTQTSLGTSDLPTN